MAKPRTCPNCHAKIPIGSGFHFDAENNLICDTCKKVVIPATYAADSRHNVVTHGPYSPYGAYGMPIGVDSDY
jgi:hypothetical protein